MPTKDGQAIRPPGWYGPSFSDIYSMGGKHSCANCGKVATLVVQCLTDRAIGDNYTCAEQVCKDAVAALTRREVDALDIRWSVTARMGGMTPSELAKKSATTVKEVSMVLAGNLTVSTDESLGRICKAVGLIFFGRKK
jgi:hypothetical protein